MSLNSLRGLLYIAAIGMVPVAIFGGRGWVLVGAALSAILCTTIGWWVHGIESKKGEDHDFETLH